MRNRLFVGVPAALAVTLAVVAGGYAASDRGSAPTAAKSTDQLRGCSGVYYLGRGTPRFIIVSDLPMQGANRPQTVQMTEAIRFILRQRNFRAGSYTIGYQVCDDSTAQRGAWDSAKCTSNARAYAADRDVIGVIGTFNSGCAKLEIPVLNRAPGGPVAMVSPANTATGLTVSGLGAEKGEPRIYYPTGRRNYARVVTRDDIQGPAGAMHAQRLGKRRVYVLNDGETYGLGVATTFRTAAQRLGIRIAGFEKWDARASSYEALAQKIRQSGATAVFLGGIVCNNGAKLIKDLGSVLPRSVSLIGPDGWTPFEATAAGGSAAQGMSISVPGVPASQLKGAGREFIRAFGRTQRGKEIQAYTAYAAQAAVVLLDAIAKSNGTRGSVSANLFKTNIRNGILGTFRIDKNGDTNLKGITFYRLVAKRGVPVRTYFPPARLTRR